MTQPHTSIESSLPFNGTKGLCRCDYVKDPEIEQSSSLLLVDKCNHMYPRRRETREISQMEQQVMEPQRQRPG